MATFAITSQGGEVRRHKVYGRYIKSKPENAMFFLWYLPTGNKFTRAIGGPYTSSEEARKVAREYAARQLGTRSATFIYR
jgi:hypothetical protein